MYKSIIFFPDIHEIIYSSFYFIIYYNVHELLYALSLSIRRMFIFSRRKLHARRCCVTNKRYITTMCVLFYERCAYNKNKLWQYRKKFVWTTIHSLYYIKRVIHIRIQKECAIFIYILLSINLFGIVRFFTSSSCPEFFYRYQFIVIIILYTNDHQATNKY